MYSMESWRASDEASAGPLIVVCLTRALGVTD